MKDNAPCPRILSNGGYNLSHIQWTLTIFTLIQLELISSADQCPGQRNCSILVWTEKKIITFCPTRSFSNSQVLTGFLGFSVRSRGKGSETSETSEKGKWSETWLNLVPVLLHDLRLSFFRRFNDEKSRERAEERKKSQKKSEKKSKARQQNGLLPLFSLFPIFFNPVPPSLSSLAL